MESKLAIVISDFYEKISNNLLDGAKRKYNDYYDNNSFDDNVDTFNVPGAFEICGTVKRILDSHLQYDAIIAYGCIIKGETAHFDFISKTVATGIKDLSIDKKTTIPILFGVLTTFDYEQALERSNLNNLDKGGEVMSSALNTIETYKKILK